MTTYVCDQSQGADPRVLSALGKQIMAAAKALGQLVTLPQAPAAPGAASETLSAGPAAKKGNVNVTA